VYIFLEIEYPKSSEKNHNRHNFKGGTMQNHHAERWNQLCDYVTAQMKKRGVPGVAVGIFHNGEVQTAGFGVTNVDHPLPVTDETLFQIGSISKTFAATLAMRLVEEGKLDLDATVRTYLPDFRVADEETSQKVTLRHLLTHMAGWEGDFFHDTGPGDDALARYVAGMAALEQLAPLDTVWSYNNAGFPVLGYIIEKVTGKPYQQLLKELVLDPLSLQKSFLDPGDVMTYRFASGHNVSDDGAQVVRPWPLGRYVYPMGGIICHVKELLRYAQFHLGDGTGPDGKRLLAQATLHQMQTPQSVRWQDEQIGLSWFVDNVDGVTQISHTGGTTGQISLLALFPARNFALAVLTNAYQGTQLNQALRRWVTKAYLDLEIPEPKPIESSQEDLAQYAGFYSRPFADIELGLLNGRLIAQIVNKKGFPNEDVPPSPPPPPFTLGRCEEDRLLVLEGPLKDNRIDVIRKADGSIGWLRAGRIHVRRS
jgi:CubicO group peptidase (beta-lactamase class C family)